VLAELPDCRAEPACVTTTRDRVARLERAGRVSLLNYRPSVGLTLTRQSGVGRVAWRAGEGLPVVQCVRVRREGPLTGGRRAAALAVGSHRTPGALPPLSRPGRDLSPPLC
jgi:hypothetical protein